MANRPEIIEEEDPKLSGVKDDGEKAEKPDFGNVTNPDSARGDLNIDPRVGVTSYLGEETGEDDSALLTQIGAVSTKISQMLSPIDADIMWPTRNTFYAVDKLHHPDDVFDLREYLQLRNAYLLRALDALVITLKDLLHQDYPSAGRNYLETHGGIQSSPMTQRDVELILEHNKIFVVREKGDGSRPTMVGAYTTNCRLNAQGGGALYPVETATLGKNCYDLLDELQNYGSDTDGQDEACSDALHALTDNRLVHGAYISVDEGYRRKGIGTVLKAAVYRHLIDQGKTHLFLRTYSLRGLYRQRPDEKTPVLIHPFHPPVGNIPSTRLNRSDALMRPMGYEPVFRKLIDMGDPLMDMGDRLNAIRRLLGMLTSGSAVTSAPLTSSDSSALLLGFHNLHWLVDLTESYMDHLKSLALKDTLKRFRILERNL